MQHILQKIKRVQPIIKARKAQVDHEANLLAKIRGEKIKIVAMMKQKQSSYMEGVEELNHIRASVTRQNLAIVEQGLDFIKRQWFDLFEKVQQLEKSEKAQIAAVLRAERDYRSAEKLEAKYQSEFKLERGRREQDALDEMTLRDFGIS